ncbi:MAG: hypothetical protein E6216_07465, partial [Enterobacter asburiae]|nr:hypothetical protein [Enterobacter asburiae]
HLKIGVSVRHIFKPISYLEIQLLSGVSGGYINLSLRGLLFVLYIFYREPQRVQTQEYIYLWKMV